jgi:hypothetical protein
MVGDSGSGGTKGAVPAPGSGDAAGGKYLKADGTWGVPTSSTNWTVPGAIGSTTPNTGAFTMLTTSGNVGIGTATPVVTLAVAGAQGTAATSGTAQTAIARFETNSANGEVLDIGGLSTGQIWMQVTNRVNLATTYPLALQPNGGNVGIGTINPQDKLTIAGTTNHLFFRTNSDSVINNGMGLRSSNTGFNLNIDSYSNIAFHTDTDLNEGGGSSTEKMRITTTGNVGIGTTAPNYKLHNVGTFLTQGSDFELDDGGVNDSTGVRLFSNSGNLYLQNGSGNNIYFRNKTASTNMTIQNGGNVGIGTTAPSNALEVAGSIKSTSGGYKFPDGTTQTTVAGITGCPSGMTMVAADPSNGFVAYCIDSSNSAGIGANEAQIACQNAGKHMCRAQELYRASAAIAVSCATAIWNGDGLNFWNGAQNFANYTSGASCNSNGWAPMGNTYPYRCCR